MDVVSIPEKRMKILRNNSRYLNKLKEKVKVDVRFDEDVIIEGDDPIEVMTAKIIIKAFGRGFDLDDAMALVDEQYTLDIVDVKEYSGKSRHRLAELRGRVIGRNGKTKNIIESLSGTKIAVSGKTVSIIGRWDVIKVAREAVELLLQGRKQGTVYRFLEQKCSVNREIY